MSAAVFCYVTCSSLGEARMLARVLVDERLAASGNVIPTVTSVYRWRGAVHETEEALVILKTRADLADRLAERVGALHSYECPPVAVLPVAGGNPEYLGWIVAESGDRLAPPTDITHK